VHMVDPDAAPALDDSRGTLLHSHSEDEIIHVTSGELRLGRSAVGPGMSVAIPAGYRHGLRTPGSLSYLNYRRDASTYTGMPGTEPIMEGYETSRRFRAANPHGTIDQRRDSSCPGSRERLMCEVPDAASKGSRSSWPYGIRDYRTVESEPLSTTAASPP